MPEVAIEVGPRTPLQFEFKVALFIFGGFRQISQLGRCRWQRQENAIQWRGQLDSAARSKQTGFQRRDLILPDQEDGESQARLIRVFSRRRHETLLTSIVLDKADNRIYLLRDVQLGWLDVQTRKPLIVFALREAADGALLESRILQVVYFLLVTVATFCLGKRL